MTPKSNSDDNQPAIQEMKHWRVYFYSFWGDGDEVFVFYLEFLRKVFDGEVHRSRTLDDCDILVESVFTPDTKLYDKAWKYSFLFSGESDRRIAHLFTNTPRSNTMKDYTCVLKGGISRENIINFPLYSIYNSNFSFDEYFLKPNKCIQKVPKKDVCVIISNEYDSEGRNAFCKLLDNFFNVDYAGKYKRNVPLLTHPHCSKGFLEFVSQYKFIISMENSRNETYITEKILHGFAADTIPVYWGSTYIHEYFNKDRFLVVDDFNKECMMKTIQQMLYIAQTPDAYLQMVNQPIYPNNKATRTVDDVAREVKEYIATQHH